LLVEVKRQADKHRLPFVIHVAEMRSEVDTTMTRFGKRPLTYLADLGLLDNRTILAHCVWLDDAELEILKASGAGVVHNPVSNAKLASGIARVPEMVERGIPVALGTDGMLSNNAQSIFQEMKTAVMLQRASRLDGNLLRTEDVLDMAFLGGARVLGWDNQIGSLEQGKLADIVALNIYHPLGLSRERVMSDLLYYAGPEHVDLVMVHGTVIYEDRDFTLLDWEEVKREVTQYYSLSH
jgi:5-methylthioadenosine/S-adenosylhomocysteine deaminase